MPHVARHALTLIRAADHCRQVWSSGALLSLQIYHFQLQCPLLYITVFMTLAVQGCVLARCGGDDTLLLLTDDKVPLATR